MVDHVKKDRRVRLVVIVPIRIGIVRNRSHVVLNHVGRMELPVRMVRVVMFVAMVLPIGIVNHRMRVEHVVPMVPCVVMEIHADDVVTVIRIGLVKQRGHVVKNHVGPMGEYVKLIRHVKIVVILIPIGVRNH